MPKKLVWLRSLTRWSMFHHRSGTDNFGPTVLNANVVAVQNATKVSYMGQTTLHVTLSPQVDLET